MPASDATATLIGMIPLALGRGDTVSVPLAKRWLRESAADYATLLVYGLECEDPADRNAYGMLAMDLRYTLAACSEAIATGRPVRVRYENLDDPRERAALCNYLARICATRPEHSTGPFEATYDELAHRIVALLTGEAA